MSKVVTAPSKLGMILALKLLVTMVTCVSIYISVSWISSFSSGNKALTCVLGTLVLALELAKPLFMRLSVDMDSKWKTAVLIALSLCLSVFSLSTSLDTFGNLLGRQAEAVVKQDTVYQTELSALKTKEVMLQDQIKMYQGRIAEGYVSKTQPLLDKAMEELGGVLKEKTALVKRNLDQETKTTKGSLVTILPVYIIAVAVEVVSLVSILVLGCLGKNKSASIDTLAHTTTLLDSTEDNGEKPCAGEESVVATVAMDKTEVVERGTTEVLSIREIKREYRCGYVKAKAIQDGMKQREVRGVPVQLALVG